MKLRGIASKQHTVQPGLKPALAKNAGLPAFFRGRFIELILNSLHFKFVAAVKSYDWRRKSNIYITTNQKCRRHTKCWRRARRQLTF